MDIETTPWSQQPQLNYPAYHCLKCQNKGIKIVHDIFNPCYCLCSIHALYPKVLIRYLKSGKVDMNNYWINSTIGENRFKFSFHCGLYAKKNVERMFYLFYTLQQVLGKDLISIIMNYTFLTEVKEFAECKKFGFQTIKDDFLF